MIFIGKIWDERSAAQIIASTPKLKWSSRVCTAVWGGLTARWKCKSTTDHLALLVLLLYVCVFTSLPPKMLIDWPNKTDKFTKNDILNQQIRFFSFSYVVKKKIQLPFRVWPWLLLLEAPTCRWSSLCSTVTQAGPCVLRASCSTTTCWLLLERSLGRLEPFCHTSCVWWVEKRKKKD